MDKLFIMTLHFNLLIPTDEYEELDYLPSALTSSFLAINTVWEMTICVQSELNDRVSTFPYPAEWDKRTEKGGEERMMEMFIETEMEHCSLWWVNSTVC